MKLDELKVSAFKSAIKGYSEKAQLEPSDLRDYMKSLGFKIIETDSTYATIYEKDNLILKAASNDPCWVKFYDYCRSHSSPHLPRYGKLHEFRIPTNWGFKNISMCVMEKLSPLNMEDRRYVLNYWDYFYNNFLQMSKPTNIVNLDSIRKDERRYLKGIKEESPSLYAQLVRIMYLAIKINREGKLLCKLDLHEGNLLKRRDTLVIIDPFATW